MNKWKSIIRLMAMAGILASCGEEGIPPVDGNVPTDGLKVKVALHLSSATLEQDVETRATSPMQPEYENQITHLRILQFDSEGIRIGNELTKTFPVGLLSTTIDDLELEVGTKTLCVIGNLKKGETIDWPDNLPAFRKWTEDMSWLKTVGGTPKNLYLFGYYEGNITAATQDVNIVLGRLACRLNIIVKNYTSGTLKDVKMQLLNVPERTRLFPPSTTSDINQSDYDAEQIDGAFTTTPIYRYYYIPENVNPEETKRTQLQIAAIRNNSVTVTRTIDLGRPDIGDYSLDRNNNYTFTFILK